jgi:hypothetical protein
VHAARAEDRIRVQHQLVRRDLRQVRIVDTLYSERMNENIKK